MDLVLDVGLTGGFVVGIKGGIHEGWINVEPTGWTRSSLGLVLWLAELCDISIWSFEPVISNHLVYSRAPFTRVRGTNGIWTSCLL